MDRTLWKAENLQESVDMEVMEEDPLYDREVVTDNPDEANLVSSLLSNGMHAPVIDLDIPHKYVPSSTEGHGHLYLDVELTWNQYAGLLHHLADLGIIEASYVDFSIKRGATFVRKPGVYKEDKNESL